MIMYYPVVGPEPMYILCPNCHVLTWTTLRYKPGKLTELLAILLCCFGCFLGCCLIPYKVKACKDIEHYCPRCETLIDVLGPEPIQVICPNCHFAVMTSVRYQSGMFTYLLSGILCCFCCVFGCCLIPFMLKSCKDVEHRCPHCHIFLGRFEKIHSM